MITPTVGPMRAAAVGSDRLTVCREVVRFIPTRLGNATARHKPHCRRRKCGRKSGVLTGNHQALNNAKRTKSGHKPAHPRSQ